MGARMKFASRADRAFYRADRDARWQQQGGRCFYCKRAIARSEATNDHVVPLSKIGGIHSSGNIVAACLDCNRKKGAQTAEAFTAANAVRAILAIEGDPFLAAMLERIEARIRQAEWRLDMRPSGSFQKWLAFHRKRGTGPFMSAALKVEE